MDLCEFKGSPACKVSFMTTRIISQRKPVSKKKKKSKKQKKTLVALQEELDLVPSKPMTARNCLYLQFQDI